MMFCTIKANILKDDFYTEKLELSKTQVSSEDKLHFLEFQFQVVISVLETFLFRN